MNIAAWLNRRFFREEMDGDGACPTYLVRWTLWKHGDYGIYLHHFVGDDWSQDLHDHPKRFWTVGLWGEYLEHGSTAEPWSFRLYRAPWIRTFPAEHRHRITLWPGHDCWTLVFVGRRERDWGFWLKGVRWVPWREYVTVNGAERKACP